MFKYYRTEEKEEEEWIHGYCCMFMKRMHAIYLSILQMCCDEIIIVWILKLH